ncbi:MAG: inositol monophosphatase family protein [Anaerolineae bacterium]
MFLRRALHAATAAARSGGQAAMRACMDPLERTVKAPRDFVTNGDLAAQAAVLAEVRAAFPDHGVLSEEGSDEAGSDGYRWIVDPVDGTTNYYRGLPFFCCSVALVRDDEILAGAVYDPSRQEMFSAALGQGAYVNGEPTRAAGTAELQDCVFGLGLPYDIDETRRQLAAAQTIAPRCASLRTMGSAALALCYVACGRQDSYLHPYLHPWDAAAGVIIAREAGGVVSDVEGADWSFSSREILAAAPLVHGDLLRLVREGYGLP